MLAAAEEVVRFGERLEPDWFKESSKVLIPFSR